jgi:hypothetical protein
MADRTNSSLENPPNHLDNIDISNKPNNSNNQNNPLNSTDNRKVTLGIVKTVINRFFKEENILKSSPLDIQAKLWSLLMDEYNKLPEMIEVSNKCPPGEAIPFKNQSTDEPEQTSNEPPKDRKNKNDKESKESKESKELKDLKEKFKDKEKELRNKEKELKDKDYEFKEKEKHLQGQLVKLHEEYTKHIKFLDKAAKEEKEKNAKEIEAWANAVNHLTNEKSNLEHNNNVWKERYDQIDEQLKNKRKDYIELYKKNEELRNEASQYQSALGDARNYRLGDNDANNPTQLTKEIGIIQDKINEFCKIKGGVEIYEANLARLLSEEFNCKYELGDKVLPKAALQRAIVEIIIRKTNEYMTKGTQPEINDNRKMNKYLELDILNSTNNYLSKINTLINSRAGTDEVSFAAPIKIQQLVNAVLGDRGFGLSSDKGEHEFVQELKDEIINFMNQFRKIKKEDKKRENEDMLADIIRNVIKMFIFRIKVLEPPAELKWIEKDAKIDATLMEVGNLEDDNYDDWVVNICSFPLICVEPDSETNRKVLVPAKILAIKAEQKSAVSKFKNLITGKSGADEGGKPTKKNSIDSQIQSPYNNDN